VVRNHQRPQENLHVNGHFRDSLRVFHGSHCGNQVAPRRGRAPRAVLENVRTMQAPDIFRPDQWHDFFITVGGGAAALTGLVFVAMSLNVAVIARDATHRYRAIGTLTGFTAAFVICSLAVMGGQDHRALGIEWLVVATVAGAVYVYGYMQAIRVGESSVGLGMTRLVGGTGATLLKQLVPPCSSRVRSPVSMSRLWP
jgi:hypothetical protein